MTNSGEHNISEELLFRHFVGELGEDQHREVLDWKEASDENRIEYERVEIFYLDVKALSSIGIEGKPYNIKTAWKNVKKQNQFGGNDGITIHLSRQFLQIAASVILLIGLGWFVYDQNFTYEEVVLASTEEIVSQELADGSLISLNKNSELIYPDKFIGDKRVVVLKGEAYFDIVPDPEKPFVIKVEEIEVQVLGTSFNVEAYEKKDSILVTVNTGVVMLITDADQKKLEAGTSGIFIKSSRTLIKIESLNTGAHNYWKTKRLVFNGSTLSEVVQSIQVVYDTKITLDTLGLGDCKISVTFEDETLENVLEIIAATLQLELTKVNDSYLLKGNVCNIQ